MLELEEVNRLAIGFLNSHGYDGDQLSATLNKVKTCAPTTVRHSEERLQLLAGAASQGQRFTVTGGCHLTSDDILKSVELRVISVKVKEMEGKKEDRLARLKVVQKVKYVLERIVAKNIDVLSRVITRNTLMRCWLGTMSHPPRNVG